MAAEVHSLAGSLPVPNVQALATTGDLVEIPNRYIRPELEEDLVADGNAEKIPVVDLSRLFGDQLNRAEAAAKLRSACEDWGFFQLVNHGVSAELIGRMMAVLEAFLEQPLEDKLASSKQPPGSVEGYGQVFVVSVEQKLDWADMLYLTTLPPAQRNLSIWPTHPANFRETLEEYSLEMRRVAKLLLGLMAENLGLSPDKLIDHFKDGVMSIRMNNYPPCRDYSDKVLGLSPHSDGTGLTILLQDSLVPGLQIRRNGRWLAVDPLPGAFVVNIGDILEVMSNGRYKSIEHRAIVDRERRRLSVATFNGLAMDGVSGPLQDLVADGRASFKTLGVEEYYQYMFSNKLEGKKFLDYMKIRELQN